MKKYIVITLTILLLLIGGYYTYLYLKQRESNTTNKVLSNTLTNEGFTAKYEYIGNNTWNYTVKGNLPTPCFGLDVQALVREIYPEQVSIVASPIEPEPDEMCIQVITEASKEGTFSASDKATVDFVFKSESSK